MEKTYKDWRKHATAEELARIAELELLRFAHTREKTRIRNRCYARANTTPQTPARGGIVVDDVLEGNG
jgi:hypothetical protein